MAQDSLNLQPFKQALESLRQALSQPKDEFMRDSVIQRFEFTYELAWKTLKRHLGFDEGIENVDALSRKDLFRLAAEEVYSVAARFEKDALALLANLEARKL